jgi:hypothetical protein
VSEVEEWGVMIRIGVQQAHLRWYATQKLDIVGTALARCIDRHACCPAPNRADKDRIAAEKAVESAHKALIEREKELAKVGGS